MSSLVDPQSTDKKETSRSKKISKASLWWWPQSVFENVLLSSAKVFFSGLCNMLSARKTDCIIFGLIDGKLKRKSTSYKMTTFLYI